MPESTEQWYARVRRQLDADGPRPVPWTTWDSWPFDGEVVPTGPERTLSPEVATRMGLVPVAVEQAVGAVLDVPRLRIHRYGDGQEHLHWWLLGRPREVDQRPRADLRADLDLVAVRLVELVGGEVLRP